MGISHDKDKWKSKGKSNARIGQSKVVSVNTPGVESIESELGNTSLSGYASSKPRQGRRR